ncbi:GPW/gp25 family protein [Sphingobium sp. AP49]|uniref:GPW/gp25 family protein n=1 Tax=Sphingobium sp. AP49 TaxID=1144307 RepID=UPI00026ECECC|nr:GPW/gp25 family protein [Sphingobium sp. AP49]WHO39156.1 GPW/gp25 family protein [Sphingobium sp. AP49]
MAISFAQLGRGVRFPLVTATGWDWIMGADAVDQALRALLLTEPGERIGRPTYGAGLRRFLFQPNSVETRAEIRRAIEEAIQRHEPRVQLASISVTAPDPRTPTLLRIAITYSLRADPGPRNMVFPFYLQSVA